MIAVLFSVSALADNTSDLSAQSFDISLFENNENYSVMTDEFNGSVMITNSDKASESFKTSYFKWPAVQITPALVFNSIDDSDPLMIIYMYYFNAIKLSLKSVSFKIGDTSYQCENVSATEQFVQIARITEAVSINILGTKKYQMMDALSNTAEEIQVRYVGENKNLDFFT